MSDMRITGGYEPNDPVVMSREEYHAELRRARRRGFVAGARWLVDVTTELAERSKP